MYEQVVYNTLSLAGLARPLSTAVRYNGQYESVMLVSEPDIQVPLEACLDSTCSQCTNRKVREDLTYTGPDHIRSLLPQCLLIHALYNLESKAWFTIMTLELTYHHERLETRDATQALAS